MDRPEFGARITQWLVGFEYKMSIDMLVFVLAAGLAIVIAFCTITLQSYRTANAPPIDALRYE